MRFANHTSMKFPIEALPRMDNGKLYKRHLADEYKARAEQGAGKS